MPIAKTFLPEFPAVPGNLEDALLLLILKATNAAAPSTDVVTYLKSLSPGQDIGVDYVAARLNDTTQRAARGR